MLRLRTTAGLSLLALLIGTVGTDWLSSLTNQWREPSDRVAMVRRAHATPRHPSTEQLARGPVTVVQPRRIRQRAASIEGPALTHATAATATLRPVATPADTSQSWQQLRGHLDGHVVVRVRVDGAGRVEDASLVASSGDPVLDQHALRSVRGWRFAVPADHPQGLSGELPMRFSSQGSQLGML